MYELNTNEKNILIIIFIFTLLNYPIFGILFFVLGLFLYHYFLKKEKTKKLVKIYMNYKNFIPYLIYNRELLLFIDFLNKKMDLNYLQKNVLEFYTNTNLFLKKVYSKKKISSTNWKEYDYQKNNMYQSFHNIIYNLPNDKIKNILIFDKLQDHLKKIIEKIPYLPKNYYDYTFNEIPKPIENFK
jgi:hypothetical protein